MMSRFKIGLAPLVIAVVMMTLAVPVSARVTHQTATLPARTSIPTLVRSTYLPASIGTDLLVLPDGNLIADGVGADTLFKLSRAGMSPSKFWSPPPCVQINQMALGPANSVYVSGAADSSCLPTTRNAVQKHYGGGTTDAYIVEIDSRGNVRYSSYLGGSQTDIPSSLAVDANGAAYIGGATCSPNFPLKNPLQRKAKSGACTGFVAKVRSRSGLVYSTYLGGSDMADEVLGVASDSIGNTYVTGQTLSSDFPIKNAVQAKHAGTCSWTHQCRRYDAFLVKLGRAGKLVYGSYLGGRRGDTVPCATCIAVDSKGDATVAGRTSSAYFPLRNASQSTYKGGSGQMNGVHGDVFVSTLKSSGRSFLSSSYLGGKGDDSPYGLALDARGHIYVVGGTFSDDFPVRLAPQRHYGGDGGECIGDPACPGGDGFVAELKQAGGLMYSTYLGGRRVDAADNVTTHGGLAYVTGTTNSPDYPLVPGAAKRPESGDFLTTIGWK